MNGLKKKSSQNVLSKQLRKRRKWAQENKFLVPFTCHSLGKKMRLLFCFDFLRVDTCGLCLPSTLPASPLVSSPGSSCGDHLPPTLRGWGPHCDPSPLPGHWSGPQVPLWRLCMFHPLSPVISSRMGMESKCIIWDSGIWVDLLGKRSWAGRLYRSSGVGGGARTQVKRTYLRRKPVKYYKVDKAKWIDQERMRDKILRTMFQHLYPAIPDVKLIGPLFYLNYFE